MIKTIISFCILSSIYGCTAPSNKKVRTSDLDTNVLVGEKIGTISRLNEYKVNPCLFSLLTSIINANKKHYPSNLFFYSLSWGKENKNRRLTVMPELWNESNRNDYKGIIKFRNGTMLCRGSFEQDVLFKKTANLISVKFKVAKSHSELTYLAEPVLQGAFVNCDGAPIYMEIYTKETVPGLKMYRQ